MTKRHSLTIRQVEQLQRNRQAVNAKIGMVKIAIKDLQMDDPTYRALLLRVTGNDTLKLCTEYEIDCVVEEMKRLGFKPKSKSGSKPGKSQFDSFAEATVIRAIWKQLYAIGEVKNPADAALIKYIERIGKVSSVTWLSADKVLTVLETLKKWAVRVFPDKMRGLWLQLHAQGKRPPLTEAALRSFIVGNACGLSPDTYQNLLSCYNKLAEELEATHEHADVS
jgi:phage gp16-like protein